MLTQNACSPRFSAIPLGQAKLPQSTVMTHLYRLTQQDIPFLKRGLALLKARNGAMVPSIDGIDRNNHLELVEECFEKSIANLSNHQLKQRPVVIAATDKNYTLQGLCLGHLERLTDKGQYVYSPFPDVPSQTNPSSFSSNNWLVSLTRQKGIGQQLLGALEQCLPKRIKHVDTVAEMHAYTPAAIPLYKKMGFKPLPHLLDTRPVPQLPFEEVVKAEAGTVPTFRDIHGLPMRADRDDLARRGSQVRQQTAFKPAHDKTPVCLSHLGRFPI